MKLHPSLLAALALSILPAITHAQASVYGTFSYLNFPQAYNNNAETPSLPPNLSNSSDSQIIFNHWSNGIGAGLSLDYPSQRIYKIGLDIRGSNNPGSEVNGTEPIGGDYILAGVKLSLKPRHVHPYMVLSGGHVGTYSTAYLPSTNTGYYPADNVTVHSSELAFGIFFGLDLHLYRAVDLRLIEFGHIAASGAFNNYPGAANASLTPLSSGIVVNFGYPHHTH